MATSCFCRAAHVAFIRTGPQPALGAAPVKQAFAGLIQKAAGRDSLIFYTRRGTFTLPTTAGHGVWLSDLLSRSSPQLERLMTLEEVKQEYEQLFAHTFGAFLRSREWKTLREKGLLLI